MLLIIENENTLKSDFGSIDLAKKFYIFILYYFPFVYITRQRFHLWG